LDELSRVLFLKENLYRKVWWLSVFYSLCIQGLVRKILMELASWKYTGLLLPSPSLEIKQYLHLAVRLFIAASGTHDPLMSDYLDLEGEQPCDHPFKMAQLSIKKAEWRERGINSSGDYLKRLFEDHGESLEGQN
jgi:hypothetical protein